MKRRLLHLVDTHRGLLLSIRGSYAGRWQPTREEETRVRFYTGQHGFYCGIDLHARSMFVCILDSQGSVIVHKNIKTTPEDFLNIVGPYREDLIVAVECIFSWYWLADLCARENIPFILGHALYMKAGSGGKSKNDKTFALKIATLLRGGMIPQAYVYPAQMRATRDLLRRRMHLMHKREPYRYAPVPRTRTKLLKVTPRRGRSLSVPQTLDAVYIEAGLPPLSIPSPGERRAATNNRRTRTRLAKASGKPSNPRKIRREVTAGLTNS